uniref:Uncharacterized protein n=1 Tax=Ascaris lumbricoides TaxID=6252 RepID=A0A0M3II39_ASCLU
MKAFNRSCGLRSCSRCCKFGFTCSFRCAFDFNWSARNRIGR